jgi:hemolysin III
MEGTNHFTKREEVVNAITHGVGIVFSVVALVLLIVLSSIHGTAWHVVSFTIYGVTMLLLYCCSTLLHSFPEGKVKRVFEILDYVSIYLFIAGTYTPVALVVIPGALGWVLFGLVWGLALSGIAFKIIVAERFKYLSTILYIVLGWLAVIAIKPLVAFLPQGGVQLLVAGGVLYTLGTIFYVWRLFPYHHGVWHVFVLGGSVCHFLMMILYVLPR